MENKQSALDKAVKISIIAAVLIVAFSIAYYLVIFMPQKEKARVDQVKQEQQARDDEKKKAEERIVANKNGLASCLLAADLDYSSFWDSECKSQGLKADCTLPQYNADRAESLKKNNKDNCYKRYPQN